MGALKVYNNPMNLLKKLIYQSWHRGTRENDLLLGPFADAVLPSLSEPELKAYQAMLDHEDADLFAWITGQYPIPENEPMIRRIRDFYQCR
jgi:antitoxin CptB